MRFLQAMTVLCLSGLFFVACGGPASDTSSPAAGQVADTVYTNGKIYTVNEAQPWAEAVAIKGGKFIVVGSNADADAVTGDSTEIVDLAGQFVMPGLVDTHTHPFDSAVSQLAELVFDPVPSSLEDIQEQVAAYVQSHPCLLYTSPSPRDS